MKSALINNSLLEVRMQSVVEGLGSYFLKLIQNMSPENIELTLNFISTLRSECNFSIDYIKNLIMAISKLSVFHKNKRLKEVTREDVLLFLDSLRKPEASDPLHKWVGSYNLYRVLLVRFFKWLYYPDQPHGKRVNPRVVQDIPQLKRKEQSIYKPSDLWTEEDDLLFLKYCPNKRDRCYHAISRDTSCRVHEILKLRLKDIVFKTAQNRQYAEVYVNGKTGSRQIPLINSIPYLKDWLDEHPQKGNPYAPLICGFGRSLGRRITGSRMNRIYHFYKIGLFKKLAGGSSLQIEDKQLLIELLKKPWNPYIRRHSALTEKSKILKEHVLRQHAGWSARSQMHLKYLHYYGNESSESILEAYGIVTRNQEISERLKPRQCPNCSESNKPDSKFCAKCRMVLNYDAYQETVEDKEKKEDRLTAVENQLHAFLSAMGSMGESAKTELAQKLIQNGVYHS